MTYQLCSDKGLVAGAPISSSMHFLRDNSGCAATISSIICSVRGLRGVPGLGFCSVVASVNVARPPFWDFGALVLKGTRHLRRAQG